MIPLTVGNTLFMNWLFWALLMLGILLLVMPLLGILDAVLSVAFWLVGALFLICVTIWAVVALARNAVPRGPTEER